MNHETAYQTEAAVEYSQGKYIGGWGGGGLLYKSDRCVTSRNVDVDKPFEHTRS